MFRQHAISESSVQNLNTEKGELEPISIQGNKGFYLSYDDMKIILWNNAYEEFYLDVYSDILTKEDVVKIAESLKIE